MQFTNSELSALINTQALDIPFMLCYEGKYAAVQIDRQIKVFAFEREYA